MFQEKIKETVVTLPGPSSPSISTSTSESKSTSSTNPRPSTPRPKPIDRDMYASGALPPLSLFPKEDCPSAGRIESTRLPDSIRIPSFLSSPRTYRSNYPEDEVDWSEPTPPLPLDPGPCRNFRDPQAAADEERERHFTQQRQKRLEKLVSASDALRDAPALSAEDDLDAAERPVGPQDFDSANEEIEFARGAAGEIGSVYVPDSWRNQSTAHGSAGEDDLFSDVAEDDGDTNDDDDDGWDSEFARAEDEVSDGFDDGDDVGTGCEPAGSETWARGNTEGRSQQVAKDTGLGSAPNNPGAVPYAKHTPLTTMQDWMYAAPPALSPTESQLVALGFEFHNEMSEEDQIERFGDKAFRKALREVLPSLSRKQQWYAWRRVQDEGWIVQATTEKILKEYAKEESGECECKCPGNGESCDGDDGTCGKLLNDCRCGDCGDCNEHYRWHHPDGACEIEGELGEQTEAGRMPKCVCGEGGKVAGEGQRLSHEQECRGSEKTYYLKKGVNGELDTWTSVCGCRGQESNGQCLPDKCSCEDCPRTQTPHHRTVLNPEVCDRPSDWTGLFSHGRLIDGEPARYIREELDLGHDVPASTTSRIPGLGLLDLPSGPQQANEMIRHSVEPEMPRRQLHRESTPAFEDRSPSPSPTSHKGSLEDVEMPDAPLNTTSAPATSRLPLPQATSSPDPLSSPMHAVTAPQTPARPRSQSRSRSRSPAKAPVVATDPSTPKLTKRGGRRKSAVQGSKVEKTSTTKARAVSRKVTTAVKNATEKTGGKVREAVARIEASVKGEQEITPRRSARIRAKLEREGTPQE